MFGTRLGTRPKNFYHGTDEEAARQIQEQGFKVGLGAGGLLGRGVYCTATLDKALEYAKGPHGGIVLELEVDLGKCKELEPNDPMMTSWQSQYDSAWAPFSAANPGDIGKEENCVKDPKRIKVVRAIGRNMGALHRGGYDIIDGKLIQTHAGLQEVEVTLARPRPSKVTRVGVRRHFALDHAASRAHAYTADAAKALDQHRVMCV